MATWKVFVVAAFALACFVLVFGTIVIPISVSAEDHKWTWFAGFLVGSVFMCSMFVWFLNHADRTFRR